MGFESLATDGFVALIAGLNCTKAEFSKIYLQAQVNLPFEDRYDFQVLTASVQNDEAAYVLALTNAFNLNWLPELMIILIAENLLSENLLKSLSSIQNNGSAILQAIGDLARGFGIPDVNIKGLSNGMRWTGQVEINNVAIGSGVLIGPHLFLTAWHVVRSLFNLTAEGYVPDQLKYNRLTVTFDNRDSFSPDGRRQIMPLVQRINAAPFWCVAYSPCHDLELVNQNPSDLNELTGRWDYTIIKLATPIGLQRRYAIPDVRSVVPRPNETVTIFQYPKAVPLRYDQHKVISGTHTERSFIPHLRFLHNVNTTEGSSGGPCFDRAYNCFGIHQGIWNNLGINKGIPLNAILRDIQDRFQELPVLKPEEYPIWTFDEAAPEPILGCENFQSLVWQSVSTTRPRVILIRGAEGSGKSFRIRVLQKMLSEGAHLKVELDAEAISKLDVIAFLQYVGKKLKVEIADVVPFSDENSTPAVWLRDEILPKFFSAINERREGRLTWLIFTNLNQYAFEGPYLQDFFYSICEQVKNDEWLRIVIDGGSPQLPQELHPISQLHDVNAITEEQIAVFFRYYLNYLNRGTSDDMFLNFLTNQAIEIYRSELAKNASKAVYLLKFNLLKTMETLSRI